MMRSRLSRLHGVSIYTKHPLLTDADVSRIFYAEAIAHLNKQYFTISVSLRLHKQKKQLSVKPSKELYNESRFIYHFTLSDNYM